LWQVTDVLEQALGERDGHGEDDHEEGWHGRANGGVASSATAGGTISGCAEIAGRADGERARF
jgi:hypothetical protein